MAAPQVVLVTGASSGLGRATASLLATRGFTVFGTGRRPAAGEAAGFALLPLDVRSEESVRACVDAVLARAGRIDALVNFAGYGAYGALEETSLDEVRELFDTNFLGVMRMVNATLPAMRRQGGGRIVNVSSLNGRIGLPYVGVYGASKHAIEGYSAALRHEVRPFGIHVSVLVPGLYKTEGWAAGRKAARELPEYDRLRRSFTAALEENAAKAADPIGVAKAVVRILDKRAPRLHYLVGADAIALLGLKAVLPESLFEVLVRRSFKLDAGKDPAPRPEPGAAAAPD